MTNATPPIGYEVKFQRVGVGGGADLQIRSLLDKQQFFDPLGLALAAGISSATWPLFGLLWPSAQKLADLGGLINGPGHGGNGDTCVLSNGANIDRFEFHM